MEPTTDKSNRLVLTMLTILGAVVAAYVWYRFAA